MWPLVLAGLVGAAVAARSRPKTRYRKRQAFGPRTGLLYQTEEFPEAGFLVVRAPDGSALVTFDRDPTGHFRHVRDLGEPRMVRAIRADFEGK